MNGHWAVIPVKGLTESKTRLSDYLGDRKKLLVGALLQDVLSSVIESGVYDRVVVISPDDSTLSHVKGSSVTLVRQTGLGLNRAIEQANRLALKQSSTSLTTILADIPLARPQDFKELFNLGNEDRKVLMAPSLKGGTNVMMNQPPGMLRPSYGRWSYSKHLRLAQQNGITTYSFSNPRISFDIDTVQDLIELKHRDPHVRTLSAKVLEEIGQPLNHSRISSRGNQLTHN